MKAGILLFAALVISAVSVNAQSLKDILYSGKLKSDTGSVVRKSDDLSTKLDTSTRKPVEQPKLAPPMTVDAAGKVVAGETSTSTVVVNNADGTTTTTTTTVPQTATTDKPKDNNQLWKNYIEELTGALRTEVMTNKKIRNGTYSVLIDYAIETDGSITINSVSSDPQSSYLEEQVKQRMTLGAPQMTPLLGTNGKPRKAPKKQTITLSK